ncbi:MAG: DUF6395 domain-containing protein [Bacillaceae bacterium]|nr:DUF6395 domain-containing protein [Bacillaceae bacterium]
MKISLSQYRNELKYFFEFEGIDTKVIQKSDRANYGPAKEILDISPDSVGDEHKYFASYQKECKFYMPINWRVEDLHPDIIGLSAILLALPFAPERITLPLPVSKEFALNAEKITGRKIEPICDSLQSRKNVEPGIPALLFSGGVDSTAALGMLPNTAPLVYSQRIPRPDDPKSKRFSPDAALNSCKELRDNGRSVFIIKNDMEYLLKPTSLTTHQAISVPALLLADYLGLDCLAFGTVLEAAYGIGKGDFVDIKEKGNYKRLKELYSIVGIAYHPVTIGMTEVCTTILADKTGYGHIAESCTRAKDGKPCKICIKCFRKSLLKMAIYNTFDSDEELTNRFLSPLVKKNLLQYPMSLENIYAYSLLKYNGNSEPMNIFKKYITSGKRGYTWIDKWYEPSIDELAEKYRDQVIANADRLFEKMSTEDISEMKSFPKNGPSKEDYLVFKSEIEAFYKQFSK